MSQTRANPSSQRRHTVIHRKTFSLAFWQSGTIIQWPNDCRRAHHYLATGKVRRSHETQPAQHRIDRRSLLVGRRPPLDEPPAVLPTKADVVVIGARWTGLSAALTLARGGREVVIVEANAPGSGGSTRNAGFFGDHLRTSLSALIKQHGKSTALELAKSAKHAFTFTKNLIETEQIQCDLQDRDRLKCAYRPAHYQAMAREVELEQQVLGSSSRMLTATELRAEIGTDQYYGGELQPSAFALHPGKYLAGLLQRCQSAGVNIIANTPVQALHRNEKQVVTSRGTIAARNILVATNAYTTDFIP